MTMMSANCQRTKAFFAIEKKQREAIEYKVLLPVIQWSLQFKTLPFKNTLSFKTRCQ